MTTPTSIYPNSTLKGDWIPDAILNPSASYIMPFTTAAMEASATLFSADDSHRLVQLFATEDCQVGFLNAPVGVPANNVLVVGSFLLLRNGIYQIALPDIYLSAIGLSAAGTLFVNKLNPWNALATQIQFDRL